MSETVIGAQLYTLREFLKTPPEIAETMKKVAKMGYRAVQLSGLGKIDLKELRNITDGEGLEVAATHIGFDEMRDETQRVVDEHNTLGCKHAAIGGMPGEYRNAEGFPRFAKEATEVARKLNAGGLTFSYHNHSFELQKFGDRTGLQILIEDSGPEVLFEIDTYWIQHGGGEPTAWIDRVKDRIVLLHLKDMAVLEKGPVMAEVGEGNLNWKSILAKAQEANVRWYLVEQDTCQRSPFESLAISLRNLQAMGLK